MRQILIIFLTCASFITAKAQDVQIPTRSVYFELGGAGLIYTFNYDFRFDKTKTEGWGMRGGAGGYWINDSGFFSFPLEINRLIGKEKHFFEIGAGVTLMAFRSDYTIWECGDSGVCYPVSQRNRTEIVLPIDGSPNAMGTLNFGYRRIPVEGGISWKLNLTPVFNGNGFWPLFAGVGIGYAF